MGDRADHAGHRVQLGRLPVIYLGHEVDLGLGAQRHRDRQQARAGGERSGCYDRSVRAQLTSVAQLSLDPRAGVPQAAHRARDDPGVLAHASCMARLT